MGNIGVTIGGYALALLLGWLYLDKRDELASEIERCNTEKIASVAEAERLTRETMERASEARMAKLQDRIAREQNARLIVARALREAQDRPAKIRTVIREVSDEDQCLASPVPSLILECLRDGTDC